MFKRLQDFQMQNKFQELSDSRGQSVINQQSLMLEKQSSRAQFGVLNYGIRVRDPSQMFKFGDANWGHESAGLLTKNGSQHAGIFSKPFIGNQAGGSVDHSLANKEDDKSLGSESFKNMSVKTENFSDFRSIRNGSWNAVMQSAVAEASSSDESQPSSCAGMSVFMGKSPTFPAPNSSGSMFEVLHKVDKEHTNSVSINEVAKSESNDALTPSCDNYNNASPSTYVGLRLTTQSQRPLVNCFDPSRISQQTGHFSKPSQSPKSENNQLSNQNHMTSHLVSTNEDGQRWSTRQTVIWLDAPVRQNPSVSGSCELPSTSYAASSRITNPSSFHLQQIDVVNQNTGFLKSKKRKFSTFERLPWHKEVTEGSSNLQDISTAELEWAHSVVRLPEKLEDLDDEIAYSCWMTNGKRRLCLTTQLMQLLFQPPPANVLSEDAITHCDIVAYYASRLALGDACRLCSPVGKCMTSESSSDQDPLKVIEGFIDRSKRLEQDILRLEKKKPVIREVIMDLQDLEKFSFTNRLAKFHTRARWVTGDDGSSWTMRKLHPQKYVKPIPMPKMVPQGQNCLFL